MTWSEFTTGKKLNLTKEKARSYNFEEVLYTWEL